jgi:hypothetical protein
MSSTRKTPEQLESAKNLRGVAEAVGAAAVVGAAVASEAAAAAEVVGAALAAEVAEAALAAALVAEDVARLEQLPNYLEVTE